MLPSLLVAAAVTAPAAPVPADAVPNPTGPAPRILAVQPDATGAVWITAHVYEKRTFQQQIMTVENGKQVMKQREVEQVVGNFVRKSIGDFGGKFQTADGLPLTTEQVVRRVKDGATVLISADGKPVSPSWLRSVASDTVIMLTDELGKAYFQFGNSPFLPTTASPRLVMLGTDETGNVRLPVNPNAQQVQGYYSGEFNGRMRGRVVQPINAVDVDTVPAPKPAGPDGKKTLEDIRFIAHDITGKIVPHAEAMARLKAGGLVLLAGDNRFPDPQYLHPFRNQDDLLIIVSHELVFPAGVANPYDVSPASQPTPKAEAPVEAPILPAPPIVRPLPRPIMRPGVVRQVPANPQ
jgi:hypothetical protein